MQPTVPSSFALVRTFIFRRYIRLRSYSAAPILDSARQAARRARKRRKKEAKHERLRDFYAWCAGCQAYGCIF